MSMWSGLASVSREKGDGQRIVQGVQAPHTVLGDRDDDVPQGGQAGQRREVDVPFRRHVPAQLTDRQSGEGVR